MQFLIRFSPLFFPAFFVVFLITFLVIFLRTKELPTRLARWGLFLALVLLLLRGVVYSIEQYRAWLGNPLARYFVPPEGTLYFVRYTLFHFFSPFFLSLIVASFLCAVFWVLQRRSHGRLLNTNERLLVFFGALAAGWPGAILYAVGVFVLPLLATPWLLQKSKSPHPSPLLQGEGIGNGDPLLKGEGGGEVLSSDHHRRVRLAPFIIISALLAIALTPLLLPYTPWLAALVCRTCI